jgi:hypothetical protein
MFAHEFETKTVERADVRGVKERELFGKKGIAGVFARFVVQHAAEALLHLGGGGLGEGDNEDFVERGVLAADAIQTAPAMTSTLPRARIAFSCDSVSEFFSRGDSIRYIFDL